MDALSQLCKYTTVVADTGDLKAIARLKPQEATTNPSLVAAAFSQGIDANWLHKIKGKTPDDAIDTLTLNLGYQISQLITGRVSTEIDANLSFDTQATIKKACQYIELYDNLGLASERVLIKIAATWQGIQAAQALEKLGIHCNLTLLFTQAQAQACADAGVTLISPFVGRITDWQKQHESKNIIHIDEDLGVQSVKNIYQFYKTHGYHTQIMGASFRSIEQVVALAGCDLLTISPTLIDELANRSQPVLRKLHPSNQIYQKPKALKRDDFNQLQNNHALNGLLIQGIDGFIDARERLLRQIYPTL